MKYALISFDFPTGPNNTGNAIQTIAAAQFLPTIDKLIYYRDFSPECEGNEEYKMIMNGFWRASYFFEDVPHGIEEKLEEPVNRLPHRPLDAIMKKQHINFRKDLKLLLISMHIHFPNNTNKITLSQSVKDYLNKNGPLGARDIVTAKIMNRGGLIHIFPVV